jgi:flagellar motor switch/type III secretory pathway protein FliN
MNDFFSIKGLLTASIGDGFLSSFEASTLKPGDIIRTTRLAGTPSIILFNGTPLCPCEVVVIGGGNGKETFGVRVINRGPRVPPAEGPGARDDLIEILPTVVSLGSIRVSLAELKNVAPDTIISLGKPFSTDEDAELLVAGIPVARGKVVVLDEEMGIRITSIAGTRFTETNVRSSGFLFEQGVGITAKDYDFRRPDKFAKAAIMRMANIHGLFARNVKARVPAIAPLLSGSVYPSSVDQLTIGELRDDLKQKGGYSYFVAEIAPVRASAGTERPTEGSVARAKPFLEEEGTAHPLPERTRGHIEEYRTKKPYLTRSPIYFFYKDTVIADAREALLACLRGAWKNLADLNIRLVADDDPLAKVEIVTDNEMVCIATFEGKDKQVDLCVAYTFFTLEPYLGLLG